MTSRNFRTSRTVSSIVLAAAALVSVNAFAEGSGVDPFLDTQVKNVSTKTRAEVKNELLQAQRQGYDSSATFKNYPDVPVVSNKTRAEVRAELADAGNLTFREFYGSH